MPNETLIYLTPETANKFVLFQKYFIPFNVLLVSDFFRNKQETIVITKKSGGIIKSVVRTELTYSDNPQFNFVSD